MTDLSVQQLREETLAFIQRHRFPGGRVGQYRYSSAVAQPTLYSSTYAAMTCSLYGHLDYFSDTEIAAWIDYLNSFQDDDGLYRDPVIYGEGWYAGDAFDCGRIHLSCHVLGALICLGGLAAKSFQVAAEFADLDHLGKWLHNRDWGYHVGATGNEIMNLGTILQYARDHHNDDRAGRAVQFILDWLDTHQLDPATGIWGTLDISDPLLRSHAVQGAYHWWALYFFDARPVPCVEAAIDTVLRNQNPHGGFGWGVHNPEAPHISSACEDIDSIDPLVRMARQTDYRRDDIRAALERAVPWVLSNQMPDGGFVFMRDRPFEYGHPQLFGEAGQGAMFPTWFRTLSLAVLGKALPDHPLGQYEWHFARCPGYQFWTDH